MSEQNSRRERAFDLLRSIGVLVNTDNLKLVEAFGTAEAQRARQELESEAARLAMLLDAMIQALGGAQLTDFEASHGPVRLALDVRAELDMLRALDAEP